MQNRRKSRKDFMITIRNLYVQEHGDGPIDADALFAWAKAKQLWYPKERSVRSQFKEELADALRTEEIIDPQDQTIRKNYPVVIYHGKKQQTLWSEFAHASEGHMKLSLQQKRRGIKGEVDSSKKTIKSWNVNNKFGSLIEMSYNFDEDSIEDEFSTEYPDAPPTCGTDDEDGDGTEEG